VPDRGPGEVGRATAPPAELGTGTLDDVPFLSPAKILVILVVALVVLGPDKLPKVAKQIGGLWGDFRKFRERLETDVRGSFPDLPSTDKIAQAVRSPLSFLGTLADAHESENGAASVPADSSESVNAFGDGVQASGNGNRPAGTVRVDEEGPGVPGDSPPGSGGVVHQVRVSGVEVPDDPGMN
jgi:TatA/E family protein of Tat protein translocase